MADNEIPKQDASSLVADVGAQKVRITAEEWATKARNKTECYHLVAHGFGAYLPAVDNVTIWHLRDLADGVKKRISCTQVKYLHVPQYERLAVDDFLGFVEDFPFVQMCLPDKASEIKKMGRQYLLNVIYTQVGQKFKDWVDQRVN